MAESLPDLSDETPWGKVRGNITLFLLVVALAVLLGIAISLSRDNTAPDPPSVPWTEVTKYRFAYAETVTIYCDKDQNRWVLYHRANSGSLQEIPLGCK